ncbi:MAG TPA: sigma factor-like helix-turn-helix DNA-binding protein [Acidimicrobiales bacterium]|nr:sigma factor-like helix-turn-helix DNA-binding protein [Acidimicrobiales bacterium]
MRSRGGFDDAYVGLFATAERVAGCVLGEGPAAERIATETLARSLASWARVRRHPDLWVTKTATDLALDSVTRKRRAEPSMGKAAGVVRRDGDTEGRVGDGGEGRARPLGRDDVLEGLRHLSRRQARVVALHYLVGLEDAEVAEVLGVGEEVVQTELGKGLEVLRARLLVDAKEVDSDTAEPA